MIVNPEIGSANDFVMLLFADEMSEILMDVVGAWDRGDSGGEGLSRVSGALLHPASAPVNVNAWLFADPTKDPSAAVADDAFRKDWVSTNFKGGPLKAGGNVAGDQDSYSVGCSMLFLFYLLSQLDFTISQVVQSVPAANKIGQPTLAGGYQVLTGNTVGAFPQFQRFINAWFSPNHAQLATNNPFPLHLTDVTPAVAGQKGGIYNFLPMVNAQIIYNMAVPGGAAVGWQDVPGQEVATGGLASAFLGDDVYLFSRRATGGIVFNKAGFGKAFSPNWQPVPGFLTTSLPPAAAGRPSELFLFATAADGSIQFNQIAANGAFVGWQPMPGNIHTPMPVAAGMQDQTLFVFANTGGAVVFNQAAPGGAFVGWQAMAGAPQTNLPPATAGRESNLFVFLVGTDGQIWFNQAAPGGAFVGWQLMPGDRRTGIAVSAGMFNTTLFVYARMADGRVVYNQAAQGGAFVGWQLVR
jgi:hypothetical protein